MAQSQHLVELNFKPHLTRICCLLGCKVFIGGRIQGNIEDNMEETQPYKSPARKADLSEDFKSFLFIIITDNDVVNFTGESWGSSTGDDLPNFLLIGAECGSEEGNGIKGTSVKIS